MYGELSDSLYTCRGRVAVFSVTIETMDTPWAKRHRARVTFLLVTLFIIVFGSYSVFVLWKPPSCSDGRQNQGEAGVDCGGPCQFYCDAEVQDLRVSWARAFKASDGIYSLLAYIENPNRDKMVRSIPYRFRLYDERGIMLLEERGETYLNQEVLTGVFLGRVSLRSTVPYRTTFELLEDPIWERAERDLSVSVSEYAFVEGSIGTELRATIKNDEPVVLRDLEVIVVMYGADDNAVAASQTYIDMLEPRGERRVAFAWPYSLPDALGRVEFLSRVPPQE